MGEISPYLSINFQHENTDTEEFPVMEISGSHEP